VGRAAGARREDLPRQLPLLKEQHRLRLLQRQVVGAAFRKARHASRRQERALRGRL
jgi:hypothetical protein